MTSAKYKGNRLFKLKPIVNSTNSNEKYDFSLINYSRQCLPAEAQNFI